ncbi:MAG: adenosylcobinamide-GDP ribazoletransferase [Mobilicoccus sp.]|nr:adenosylcobinamide-GDP ribazoletransferase [Mobilicoccus sp.]
MGTLTAIPVTPPTRVDGVVAGRAMLLAPVATLPLVLAWLLVGLGVAGFMELGTATAGVPLLGAVVAVILLALGTRALHLDGLADTADGFSASYDRERALAVMKTGDVGPSGAAAIALTLGLQVAATAVLYTQASRSPGVLMLGVAALVAARLGLALACLRGTRAATPGGLGAMVAERVSPVAFAATTLLVLGALAVGATAWGFPLAGLLGVVLVIIIALTTTRILVRRARRRLGGITGDILGAGVEISSATALVTAALFGALLVP